MIESVAAVHSILLVSTPVSGRPAPVPELPARQPATTGFYQNILANGATLVAAQEAGQRGGHGQNGKVDAGGSTQGQQAQVINSWKRDAEIRRHESAHALAGGPMQARLHSNTNAAPTAGFMPLAAK